MGEMFRGNVITLEVHGEMDRFDPATLAGAVLMPDEIQGQQGLLPASTDLQLTFLAHNTFCVVPAQQGLPLPIPVFFDDLGLDRIGIEGFLGHSHFHHPMPKLGWLAVIGVISELGRFCMDAETLLESSCRCVPDLMEYIIFDADFNFYIVQWGNACTC